MQHAVIAEPSSPEEAYAEAIRCGRHVNVLMNAGEYRLASVVQAEAQRLENLALEMQRKTIDA